MNEIEDIIHKWQILQVIIKEEITLSNIISEDQKAQLEQLKDCYYDYYNTKLQIDNQLKLNEFVLLKNAESVLLEVFPIVFEMLMRFRQNDLFIIQLIDILEKNDHITSTSINDIVQFFCNQFYDDLFLSNNNEEQLLLIQKMIRREVNEISDLKPNNFLNDSTSFLGKYLKCFVANQDFISFKAMILNGALMKIKTQEKAFELNLSRIYDILKKKFSVIEKVSIRPTNNSGNDGVDLNTLTKAIPKSGFARRFSRAKSNVVFKLDEETFVTPSVSGLKDYVLVDKYHDDEFNSNNKEKYNDSYMEELTPLKLKEIINDPNTPTEFQEFLQRQLNVNEKYSNSKLISSIKTYTSFDKQILIQYKLNFIFIKEIIDDIFSCLESHIDSIPYSLRCICKMISEEITAKIPTISKYDRNTFIGEFFVRKYLTSFNIIKHHSSKTIEAFNTLSKILNKISRYQLFSEEMESQYTLFNRYIMEIIPKLNEFYDKLIDVSITEPIPPQFTCIVFNIEIILQLYAIMKDHKEKFEDLPQGKLFSKSIGKMVYHIKKMEKKVKKSKEKRYLAFFKYDADLIESVAEQSVQLNQNVNSNVTIEDKVKFCIKIILRRLNVINSKLYSHLNLADSNKNFLLALNEVIQLEEKKQTDEDMSIIPLTWYSLFMASHLDKDTDSDDYKKIYNDLLSEEQLNLTNLKEKYNSNVIRNGLFLQCAQNKIGKNKMALRQKRRDWLSIMAQKIIDELHIPVCIVKSEISSPKKSNSKRSIFSFSFLTGKKAHKAKNSTNIESSSLSTQYFQVVPLSQCIHQGTNLTKESKDNDGVSLLHHSETVKQFAYELSEFEEVQADIKIGEQGYEILKVISQYISIALKKIQETVTLPPNEIGYILELVEENIMHNLYKKVRSKVFLEIDMALSGKLEALSDLPPSKMNIPKEYINDTLLQLAVIGFTSIEKKTTPREKLQMIESTLNIIKNLMKFSGNVEKEDNVKIFEPILKYIIIQAKPSRLFADINFIRALSHSNKLAGKYDDMIDQIESAAIFFIGLDDNQFAEIKEKNIDNAE